MGLGSWARFVIGIALSLEILREVFFNEKISVLVIGLSVLYLILSGFYFVEKLVLKM